MKQSRNSKRRCARPGAALLEAVVALGIVGSVAGTSLWLASDSLVAFRRAAEHEDRIGEAQRLMTAVSLWSVRDLDLRLGETEQGPWLLDIQRGAGGLYEISIADSASSSVLLRTAILSHD